MKLKLSLLLLLITPLLFFGQGESTDTDAKYFFSVHAGVNTTQVLTKGDTFEDSTSETGYLFGAHYNVFPDYEYGHGYFRIGLEYSSESSTSGQKATYQDELVLASANFKLLELHLLGAYRFKTESKFDVYLGGGVFSQYAFNNKNEQFLFTRDNGKTLQIFINDDPSVPLRYASSVRRTNVGMLAELGGFLNVGSRLVSIAGGFKYAFFLGGVSGSVSPNKLNLYLTLGCEVF